MTKKISFTDYDKGDSIPELSIKPVVQMDLVRYAGASGDFNPIHTDPSFATKVGLDGTIAHGMFVMAQMGRYIGSWVHLSQLRSFGVKFRGMVRPGDQIVCSAVVRRKKEEEDGTKQITITVTASVDGEPRVSGDAVIIC